MTAERMPPSKSSFFVDLLVLITRWVVRHPWPTVSAAVAVAIAALLLTATRLEIRTSRLDLLDPNSPYNQRWRAYIDEFGHRDDVVVVVEGDRREEIVAAIEQIAAAVATHDRLFDGLLYRIDLTRIGAKGLHYLPLPQLLTINRFLDQVEPLLQGDWSQLDIGGTLARHGSERLAASASHQLGADLAQLTAALHAALSQSVSPAYSGLALPALATAQTGLTTDYLLAGGARFGLVALRLARAGDSPDRDEAAIGVLRGLLRSIRPAHPNVRIGLTGLPVMEQDEMQSSRTATARASLVSMIGVACLFAAGFGGLRQSLMTMVALALGIAWSIGCATLLVGHLNILSMAFGIILIGLGIDFGIHYLARYQQLRSAARSSQQALCATIAGVGPGIITGGVTTSIAFFTAGLTEFTGIAELGLIAGAGVLLCLLATLFVLPALLKLTDPLDAGQRMPEALALGGWIGPAHRAPRTTLVLACAITAIVAMGLVWLRYDHNLLNLQPAGLESVELERKLLAESDQSLWFALSIADHRDELLARKQRLVQLESVERVEEIASLLPAADNQKQRVIRQIHDRLGMLPARPPQIPVSPPQGVGPIVTRLKALAADHRLDLQIQRQLDSLDNLLRRMPPQEWYRRLADYQQRAATDLLDRLHALARIADPDPPDLADLPVSLVRRFVSPSGRHLMRIYGKADIWNMDALAAFVADVRRVDPEATGKPLQTYEASRQMQRSYLLAGLYSLVAVAVILVLDFRALRVVLLAMLPLAVGVLQMLGLLGWLGIPLNPANMIVLPLILGIGIDDGVHVIHDYRTQQGRFRLSNSTATAVLMTSLTSMVGFGSLMIASHRGLESLGRVLTIGVCCCLFTSLTILPAVLTWLSATGRGARASRPAASRAEDSNGPHWHASRPHWVSAARVANHPAGQYTASAEPAADREDVA